MILHTYEDGSEMTLGKLVAAGGIAAIGSGILIWINKKRTDRFYKKYNAQFDKS